MTRASNTSSRSTSPAGLGGLVGSEAEAVVGRLRELADSPPLELFRCLSASPKGLTEAEAAVRLAGCGDNQMPAPAEAGLARRVVTAVRSPFVGLLAGLGVVFAALGDARGALTVAAMVALSVGVRLWQHTRSLRSVAALRAQVSVTATVRRRATDGCPPVEREIPSQDVVPGDVVLLAPGDLVPADVRVLAAADLVVDQSTLSGEAVPVSKRVPAPPRTAHHHWRRHPDRRQVAPELVDAPALCFAGTSVVSGTATTVVIATGAQTYAGSIARHTTSAERPESSFDRGVRRVGWTLVRFMLVLVPIVLAVNGAVSGDWARAVMFAVAVAVGLTPEMLPVIVTTNLTRGAVRLARDKVIVKRLNAIQDLAATDVLCVDKTGTLTEDRVAYAHSIDPEGRPDGQAAEYAYLALHFQTGPRDRFDSAIATQLADSADNTKGHPDDRVSAGAEDLLIEAFYQQVDEIGFDPYRRRATVVVRREPGEHVLITKGDPDVVLARCTHAAALGTVTEFGPSDLTRARDVVAAHAKQGMRILAVAIKHCPARYARYGEGDEAGLMLVGFIGFVDPVGEGVADAVRALSRHGVAVKVLTGDNEQVTAHVCAQVGVRVGEIVTGRRIDATDNTALRALVESHTVFAKLTPAHKVRIVAALREGGHVVGFLGDGVNDAPALCTADVGIAADTATDVAKDAADLILLEKDLGVIARGITEGRRTLGNTLKYVHITASSNFGNVLTVLAASVFLPFLPMLPIQLVVQNLLYDTAQLALPWDRVDPAYLRRPRQWDAGGLTRFMLAFGPLSSLFDMATFAVLWWVFHTGTHPALFQTGWFVEGLCSQLLVVFVLRTAVLSWRGARPGRPVLLASLTVALVGLLLPLTALAGPLGMRPLPGGYLLWLAAVLLGYGLAAELAKRLYLRRRLPWW
ncbi:magnesium-translocating P-type ATPase [Pseudonocardia sp. Cha107L01]|uniref:magnesium-translocating P-type ATPase n=1 Tax=Pseudonocardia sp. Cha107L01 TaxID=3457576 RepID=UPI00403E8D81